MTGVEPAACNISQVPESSIIAVGNEILRGFTIDTNSHWLAGRLFARGFPLRRIDVVADDEADIAAAVEAHLQRSELARILVCGGLGPTPDDRTSAGLARALGRRLVYDRATGAMMQNLMFLRNVAATRGTAELNAGNRKMALVPEGARLLRNGPGMAPGLMFLVSAGRYLFALPGVPHELRAIVEEVIEPTYLQGGAAPAVRELRYRGAPESAFYQVMHELEAEYPDVSIGSYPKTEVRELTLRASGPDAGRVEAAILEIRRRVPNYPPVA